MSHLFEELSSSSTVRGSNFLWIGIPYVKRVEISPLLRGRERARALLRGSSLILKAGIEGVTAFRSFPLEKWFLVKSPHMNHAMWEENTALLPVKVCIYWNNSDALLSACAFCAALETVFVHRKESLRRGGLTPLVSFVSSSPQVRGSPVGAPAPRSQHNTSKLVFHPFYFLQKRSQSPQTPRRRLIVTARICIILHWSCGNMFALFSPAREIEKWPALGNWVHTGAAPRELS